MDCPTSPYDLITNHAVTEAVKAEYGPNAQLLSWNLQDFVKSCDNFSSFVTSIKFRVNSDGNESSHSYIAKVNPCRQNECWKCLTNSVFIREEYFLHDIAPRLCNILRAFNNHPLRLPVDLYASCAIGKEILISKDLREDDFKMAERRTGLDLNHASLVLQELARLHAASFLLEEQNIGEELEDMYPFLQEEYGDDQHIYYKMFEQFTLNQLKTTNRLLEAYGGYDNVVHWIQSMMYNTQAIMKEKLHDTPNKFKVICHGDLQINNILFRYDQKNHPVEVMLLDLQRARVSSIASDLNYFLYSSLDGATRRLGLSSLLQDYFSSFSNVMHSAKIPVPFTLEELHREFTEKNILGFIYGINGAVMHLMESEGIQTFDAGNFQIVDDNKIMKAIQNPMFTGRVKAIVDEMIERNLPIV